MTQLFDQHVWAVVLAGGDGTRLAPLTRNASGTAVPKQFCSLSGGPTLFEETLWRAHRIARQDRVTAIVAAQHRRWWGRELGRSLHGGLIVQPANRGTANGILLSALWIAMRDPLARVVFLPSDHYVRDEGLLAKALQETAASGWLEAVLILLGIEPDEPDPELGYIVPGSSFASPDLSRVACFVEKPGRNVAANLLVHGALWNSFIFAGDVYTIVELVRARYPTVVEALERALVRGPDAIKAAYDTLPMLDFSRHILQGAEEYLLVSHAPPCGWSDLGTPTRVAACLKRLPYSRARGTHRVTPRAINLAAECARRRFGPAAQQVSP